MKKFLMTAAVAVAFVGFSATALTAQPRNCGPHAVVVERLASGYGEVRVSIALGSNGTVVENFANLETGTWTITVTVAGGPTCLVVSGEAYQLLRELPVPEDDPT